MDPKNDNQAPDPKRGKAVAFEIAGHSVPPGTRLRFDLPAANLYTHAPLGISVEVIHGQHEGPVLLVCAAIHGDEVNGMEIVRRLRSLAGLESIRGTLILVPVVNVFGFIHQSRYLPDRRDLNRCFPGSKKGSIASRLARVFFSEVVTKATHIVDLHTGAVNRENLPQVRAALDEPGVREMALGFSIPVILNSKLIEKSLRSAAGRIDIPVVTYEAGEALRLEEKAVVTGVRGLLGVMRALEMLSSEHAQSSPAEPFIAQSSSWLRASMDGLFRPLVKPGARVQAGTPLGVISAPLSLEESVLIADSDGIVVGASNLPLVNAGEALFHIARFAKPAAVEEEIVSHVGDIQKDPLFAVEALTHAKV